MKLIQYLSLFMLVAVLFIGTIPQGQLVFADDNKGSNDDEHENEGAEDGNDDDSQENENDENDQNLDVTNVVTTDNNSITIQDSTNSSDVEQLKLENQELREENSQLRKQLENLQQIIMEQIKVIIDTLTKLRIQ